MIGHLSLTLNGLSLVVILLIMKIFKERYQEEIIIMPQKLIEKYNNLAREALSMETRYYQRTIFNTLIILQDL